MLTLPSYDMDTRDSTVSKTPTHLTPHESRPQFMLVAACRWCQPARLMLHETAPVAPKLHYLMEQRISLSVEIAFSLAPDLLLRNSNGGCKVQVGVKAEHILDQCDLPRQIK